ncbi:MAG: c-type cytochrome [Vicinamibacterales bacterium]
MKTVLSTFMLATAVAMAPQSRTTADGVYSADQATRGEAGFRQNCSSCHGVDLAGAEGGPPLTGTEFNERWKGMTLNDLFILMKSTMPQSSPGSLSDKEYIDILAFILLKGEFPDGTADLVPEEGSLSQITYQ